MESLAETVGGGVEKGRGLLTSKVQDPMAPRRGQEHQVLPCLHLAKKEEELY